MARGEIILHAAVAISAFPSKNVKKLRGSEHFLKLTCGKIARRCGEKHVSRNAKKLTVSEDFLSSHVENCTPL